MDDKLNPDDSGFYRVADDESPSRFLASRRVALLKNDAVLAAMLRKCGAVLCDPADDQVELIVLESHHSNVDFLRDRMGNGTLDRIEEGHVQIISPLQLRECLNQPDPQVSSLHTPAMLAELLGVPVSTIRSWHRRGLIQAVSKISKLPYFDFLEVAAAKQLATLVEMGIKPATIEKNLLQLSTWLPHINRPLAQLSILVEGKGLLLRQGGGLVEPGGQKRFDFDHANPSDSSHSDQQRPAAVILKFGHRQPDEPFVADVNSFVTMAEQFESDGLMEEAIDTWRSMQLALGPDSETCLRIGELLYRAGDIEAARERYYMAIELDDQMVEARAALGCVLVELQEIDFAISAFEGALDIHPDYADVHFHLAQTHENAGNSVQALKHWKRFVHLTPGGPWAEQAIARIAALQPNQAHESLTLTHRQGLTFGKGILIK